MRSGSVASTTRHTSATDSTVAGSLPSLATDHATGDVSTSVTSTVTAPRVQRVSTRSKTSWSTRVSVDEGAGGGATADVLTGCRASVETPRRWNGCR